VKRGSTIPAGLITLKLFKSIEGGLTAPGAASYRVEQIHRFFGVELREGAVHVSSATGDT
jgi:hypothetical protein